MFELTPFNNRSLRNRRSDFVDVFNIMDDFFNNDFFPANSFKYNTFKIDVKDSDTEYLIEAELPGIEKEEVNLDYNDGVLVISVEKNEEVKEEKENYIHKERRVAAMKRALQLKDVKEEEISAKLENGVLKITLPKSQKANSKVNIQVQ